MKPRPPPIAQLPAPAHWRTVEFISDLHLHAGDRATFLAWKRYLLGTRADAVFMLGDLFEAWIGDDVVDAPAGAGAAANSFEAECLDVLRQAAGTTALFFMHGNRDFLVGDEFLRRCPMQLLQDPTVLEFSSRRWLLTHGDALCLDDLDYMAFRAQVRDPDWQRRFLELDLEVRRGIARDMRAQSEQAARSGAYTIDVDAQAARDWLAAAHASAMIHGHTHRPAEHDLGQGMQRTVLSDWDCQAAPTRAQALRIQAGSAGSATTTVQRVDLEPG